MVVQGLNVWDKLTKVDGHGASRDRVMKECWQAMAAG